MALRIRPWVWVVAAIVTIGIVGIVAVAAAGFYFFTRSIRTSEASPVAAARRFEDVRAQFTNRKPLIELDDDGDFVRSNLVRERPSSPPPLESIHVMAYEPMDARIVHVTIPFWLLRLQRHGGVVNFNGNEMNLEDLKISVEDLERFGPTLIVDHEAAHGARVLVWSQ